MRQDDLMTSAPPPHNFDLVRRGYAPAQVDQTMTQIVNDLGAMRRELDNERSRRVQQTEQLEALHSERALMDPTGTGSYRGLGERVEQIFRLAEEEARAARDSALAAADEHRRGAHEETAAARQDADTYATERRGAAEADATRIVEEAQRAADTVLEEAEQAASARREEAEGIFELNRAKAAQAAADFETTLADRRAQAERAHTERLTAAETTLQDSQQRSDAMTAEADAIRAEAESKAQQTIDAATAQAEQMLVDARANTQRISDDAERELADLTQRRDTINEQLANVRRMLATLTGVTVDAPAQPDDAVPVEYEYIEVEYADEGEEVGDVQVEFVDLDDDEPAAADDASPGEDEAIAPAGVAAAATSDDAGLAEDASADPSGANGAAPIASKDAVDRAAAEPAGAGHPAH